MQIGNSAGYNIVCLSLSLTILHSVVMAQLAPLVVPALKKHTATVIWAHGLGDTYVLIPTRGAKELTTTADTDGERDLFSL